MGMTLCEEAGSGVLCVFWNIPGICCLVTLGGKGGNRKEISLCYQTQVLTLTAFKGCFSWHN